MRTPGQNPGMPWGTLIVVLFVGVVGLAAMALYTLPKDAEIGIHVGVHGLDDFERRNFALGFFLGLAVFALMLAVLVDLAGPAVFLLAVTFLVELVAVVRAMAEHHAD